MAQPQHSPSMTLILFPPFTSECFQPPRSIMAGGLQTPNNAPTTKTCPFSPQVKAVESKTLQQAKGRRAPGGECCYCKARQVPVKAQKPRVTALLLVLLLTNHPHSQETWMTREKKKHFIVHATALNAGLFPLLPSPLSHCSWGVLDVCTFTESAGKQRPSVHDLSLMAIPRTNHSPCLLPPSHKDLMQRWIPSVVSILPPLADTSGHLCCRKLATLQQFAAPKSKTNQTEISSMDTLYEANTRFYSLSRYWKH